MGFEIDLRSDTVTKPCPAMRRSMAEAEVGDDVIDVDPTVVRLQQRAAELLGKEASLFMPSGSMTNQIALRIHCQPGDEFLCDSECHIYNYEQGAFAQLSGLVARTLPGVHGILQPQQFADMIRTSADHTVRTRLVCLENTHNRGGGTIQPLGVVEAICGWAQEHGLLTHLDGARLFNAVAATNIPAERWCAPFDSVSLCFSKGLGAPVGSVLAGSAEFVRRARRARKLFGGGMRQAGILAAGALYALEHNRQRLVDDHEHAQLLGRALAEVPGIALQPERIETNMVIFRLDRQLGTAADFAAKVAARGVGIMPFGPQLIRLVTHLDVSRAQALRAAEVIREAAV
jgi:threonine aldolase